MSYEVEKEWMTKAGLRAVVIMVSLGHRCGYVGIEQGHPLHGVKYSQPTPVLTLNMERSTEKMSPIQVLGAALKDESELRSPEYVFEVHGGLTYSGGSEAYPVKSEALWWFGYDCAHAGDAPAPGSMFVYEGDVHRTLEYCEAECESLAQQLAAVTPSVQHLPSDDTEGGAV